MGEWKDSNPRLSRHLAEETEENYKKKYAEENKYVLKIELNSEGSGTLTNPKNETESASENSL